MLEEYEWMQARRGPKESGKKICGKKVVPGMPLLAGGHRGGWRLPLLVVPAEQFWDQFTSMLFQTVVPTRASLSRRRFQAKSGHPQILDHLWRSEIRNRFYCHRMRRLRQRWSIDHL
ncbi:MAG: hypothetical protein ACKV0T_17150 [Planctomycetales bacterium]